MADDQRSTTAKVTYRVRVNRRGVFLLRLERSRANGHGATVRTLIRWKRHPSSQEQMESAVRRFFDGD